MPTPKMLVALGNVCGVFILALLLQGVGVVALVAAYGLAHVGQKCAEWRIKLFIFARTQAYGARAGQ